MWQVFARILPAGLWLMAGLPLPDGVTRNLTFAVSAGQIARLQPLT